MSTKQRITVTLDPELVRAGNDAVRRKRAPSLSEWVNAALTARVDEEKRLKAARRAVAALDRAHGAMGDDEVEARVTKLRERGVGVTPVKRRAARASARRVA